LGEITWIPPVAPISLVTSQKSQLPFSCFSVPQAFGDYIDATDLVGFFKRVHLERNRNNRFQNSPPVIS